MNSIFELHLKFEKQTISRPLWTEMTINVKLLPKYNIMENNNHFLIFNRLNLYILKLNHTKIFYS